MTIFNQSTRALKWCTWANIAMLVFCLIAMLIDDRRLLGESVWLKPTKFAISISIYCTTIALLFQIYPYHTTKEFPCQKYESESEYLLFWRGF